jgi:hypothetical protein
MSTRPEDLHSIIVQLDGVRAFRRMDSLKIESSFKRVGAYDKWLQLRSDIEKIVNLPNTLPRVSTLIKTAFLLRSLFPACLFSIILLLLIKGGIISAPSFLEKIFWIIPFLVITSFIAVDFMARKRIASYEIDNQDLLKEEKNRIKKAVEFFIKRLCHVLEETEKDQSSYRMRLFFNDYEGIEVVRAFKERAFGIFKKTYYMYIVTPGHSFKRDSAKNL